MKLLITILIATGIGCATTQRRPQFQCIDHKCVYDGVVDSNCNCGQKAPGPAPKNASEGNGEGDERR